MLEKLVSIVIPVYKVEKYFAQCLESVIEQTYKNLEIIVVDDESPDCCGKIAEQYKEEDNRIQVFHIKNRGAAGARNVGLEKCHGDYILFVDSDDWLELDMVEKLVNAIEETDSDIALCQYWDEYCNHSSQHKFMECSGLQTSQEFTEGMIKHWEYIITWNKLFRNTVLESVWFVEGHCIDDEFFTYKAVINSKKTVLLEDCLYHYRMRKSGAMLNPAHRRQQLQDQIDFITQRYTPLVSEFPELKSKLLQHKAEVLISVMKNSNGDVSIYKKAKMHLLKDSFQIIINRKIDLNVKKSMVIYLFRRCGGQLMEALSENVEEEYYE